MSAKKITIAVDGHSSTGKSTMARQLAETLGYIYVDSGAMYRCIALYALQNGLYSGTLNTNKLLADLPKIDIAFRHVAATGKNHVFLNGVDVEDEIRNMRVSEKVSEVAAIPEVRRYLVSIQQELGKNKGVVMDGRDIGTVVFPDAELKIFMTASPDVRAERRLKELQKKGERVDFESVLANIQKRDLDDSTRKDSPLRKASDAKELDNSELSRSKQLEIAINWAKDAINSA